jgi:hypothetical protein
MRCVIDSNILQDPLLRDYLSLSRNNMVVLTDYLMMEAYKGDTLKSIFKSMEILCDFPEQVLILKNTRTVVSLRGRVSGLTRRMMQPHGQGPFADFCTALKAAQYEGALAKALIAHGQAASEHMEKMLKEPAEFIGMLEQLASNYSEEERYAFRTKDKITKAVAFKTLNIVEALTFDVLKQVPNPPRVVGREILNLFVFRFAVCGVLLVLRWIRNGEQKNIKPGKLRNDIVDLNFAAYGTYFDLLITKDHALKDLYGEAWTILKHLGAPVL